MQKSRGLGGEPGPALSITNFSSHTTATHTHTHTHTHCVINHLACVDEVLSVDISPDDEIHNPSCVDIQPLSDDGFGTVLYTSTQCYNVLSWDL